jgi:hypothetical protein
VKGCYIKFGAEIACTFGAPNPDLKVSKRNMNSAARSNYREDDAVADRIGACDWKLVSAELYEQGYTLLKGLLSVDECDSLARLFSQDEFFRSRVVMKRHGFGSGEYKYFRYPLPKLIAELRTAAYSHLVETANRWNSMMRMDVQYPATHKDFLKRCHGAGQTKPTPLLLSYGPDDYNCLHQDLYGEHSFPLQLTVLLSDEQRDFSGGEFVLVEQRPRLQSKPMVVSLRQGDAVVFAVRNRPVQGKRGPYRVTLRHGVSRVRSGKRHALGVIFHDAG